MFCPSCGASVEAGAKFCPECGATLNNENTQSNYEQPNEYQQQGYTQPDYQQGYSQPYGNVPMGGGTNRSIVLCIVLLFVTCGIYGIYWMIKLNDELNNLNGTPEDTSGVMVFILTLVTCGIYGLYWFYKMGGKVDNIKAGMGMAPSSLSSSILYLLLALFGLSLVDYCLMQDTINKASI
ncbi:MAG: DUF4234 domain-containing protein [Lachnospiraceae bacterium]|nr:DUF4234 domain-containing protein [Lachnospiraceae bacterium]